jgi:hypothetical protein
LSGGGKGGHLSLLNRPLSLLQTHGQSGIVAERVFEATRDELLQPIERLLLASLSETAVRVQLDSMIENGLPQLGNVWSNAGSGRDVCN